LIDSVINPLDIETLAKQFNAGVTTRWICIDNFLEESFANAVADAYPDYSDAQTHGREFTAVNERLKVQIVEANLFPDPVARLNQALASSAWLETVRKFTGIDKVVADPQLVGGGMHLYSSGAHLDVHVDFNKLNGRELYRRLNILVFMNRGWDDSWGGEFELWNKDVSKIERAMQPIFNRCVIFETTEQSYHGVTKVKCPDGMSRNSFAAYYYTPCAPDNYTGEDHSTVFRARPEERLKRFVLMPGEVLIRQTRQKIAGVGRRLRGE